MRSLVMIMALSVCFSATVSAGISEILTVEEPPSSYVDDNGNISGFAVDVVREAQRRIGDNTAINVVPEARVLNIALNKPNALFFAFSKTPEREKKFHMISLLMFKPWVFYKRSESPIVIKRLQDIKLSSSVGVVIGDIRERYLSQKGFKNLSKTVNHRQNLRMLQLNRIELMFYEPLGMAYLCRQLNIPLSTFTPVYSPETSEVFLMLSKKGTSADVVKQWKSVLSEIKKDGTFKRIADKWSKKILAETGLSYQYKNGALNFMHEMKGSLAN